MLQPAASRVGLLFQQSIAAGWSAVLDGRDQLFETTERGGAGCLEGVAVPQGSGAMHRPVVGLRQGRRREHNIMIEIQKVLVL